MPTQRWSTLTLVSAVVASAGVAYWAGSFHRAGENHAPIVSSRATETPLRAAVQTPPSAAAVAIAFETRWRNLARSARTPESERQMVALLSELAAHDPRLAMTLATAEPNWRLQAELRVAVFRGWAETDPAAAFHAALARGDQERTDALAGVFGGAARDPDVVVRLGAEACDREPARSADYGRAVIAALSDAGAYSAAVTFVRQRGESPLRTEEMETAFRLWAEHQPESAIGALQQVDDQALHAAAVRGMVVGWSNADPVALANYAIQLPAGEVREQALANAVPRWVEHDPIAAASWLEQRDPQPELDMGVVAVATLPNMIQQRPELAMSLAQTITDAPLRANTLENVALKWAEADAPAARQYVETSGKFTADQRKTILVEMGTTPGG